jgi:hypothetical protein
LLQCMSPVLAQSGHAGMSAICPLSGVKRTSNAQIAFFRFRSKPDISARFLLQCIPVIAIDLRKRYDDTGPTLNR